jgi:hypothetical protein
VQLSRGGTEDCAKIPPLAKTNGHQTPCCHPVKIIIYQPVRSSHMKPDPCVLVTIHLDTIHLDTIHHHSPSCFQSIANRSIGGSNLGTAISTTMAGPAGGWRAKERYTSPLEASSSRCQVWNEPFCTIITIAWSDCRRCPKRKWRLASTCGFYCTRLDGRRWLSLQCRIQRLCTAPVCRICLVSIVPRSTAILHSSGRRRRLAADPAAHTPTAMLLPTRPRTLRRKQPATVEQPERKEI